MVVVVLGVVLSVMVVFLGVGLLLAVLEEEFTPEDQQEVFCLLSKLPEGDEGDALGELSGSLVQGANQVYGDPQLLDGKPEFFGGGQRELTDLSQEVEGLLVVAKELVLGQVGVRHGFVTLNGRAG